jgi:hypothetical protein
MGIAKCPYDPADNSTALWVENGNPGDLPGLYSGTNAEFTKADTVIFRTDLHNLTTGRREFSFKRTLKYDSKWLDSEYRFGSFSGPECSEVVHNSAVKWPGLNLNKDLACADKGDEKDTNCSTYRGDMYTNIRTKMLNRDVS